MACVSTLCTHCQRRSAAPVAWWASLCSESTTRPRDLASAAQTSRPMAASRSLHRRAAAAAAAAASSRRKRASACHRHLRHAAERPCARQLLVARSAPLHAADRARANPNQCAKAPPRVR